MKKIIIVDDNYKTSEGIYRHMDWKQLDIEVVNIFTNPEEALKCIQKQSIDLIITDINMPSMNGIELTKKALALLPMIKVIFISAYDEFRYAQEAVRLDVCDYIEKPIDFKYLHALLESTIEKINEENDILYQIKENKPLLTEKFFIDLIESSPKYASYYLADQARFLGINTSDETYICVIFDIKNLRDLMTIHHIEQCHISLIQLKNAFYHSFITMGSIYSFQQGDNIIFIIGTQIDQYKKLNRDLEKFSNFFQTILSYKIGIGVIVKDIWEISISFNRAEQALEHQFIYPETNVFNAKEIDDLQQPPLIFTDEEEDLLVRLISTNNLAEIKQFIDKLRLQWTDQGASKNFIHAHIYKLIVRIIKFSQDTNIIDSKWNQQVSLFFVDIHEMETLEQITKHFYILCEKLCSKFDQSISNRTEVITEEIKIYIHNHYMDYNLNLNSIAEEINLNASYLGSIFKRATDTNIPKYITKIRMERAKELLENPQLKIKNISELVGYANQYYFSASFKKYYGKTPSEYRS
ncbi:response regulator [Gracilibacillus massiliensis]|uniref:response regulator n=1 Tax=Gracilibacillus massiliensis TaxID=1564956 RepID=UPI00071DB79C|nr:response regulator [Gracilibacillus massiliensis]